MTTQNNRKTSRNPVDIVKDVIFQIFRLFSVIWGLFRPFLAMFWQNLAWNSKCHRRKSAISNHLHQISACLAIDLSGDMANLWQLRVLGKILPKRPKMAEKGPKWQKMVWISDKWHSKPSPSDFCSSCDCFEWSYDQFMTILTLGPKLAKSGQKWPKKAQNDRTWSEYLKSDIRNHLHWISASLAIILSGHMTSLRQVWVWGQNWLKNGQKWPKKAPNGQKWPERMENDFWNHRHWNSAPLAVVLSGHMTSLWQFFLRDPKWPKMTKNGQKWPQNDPKWCDCQKNVWNWFISQIWSIFDRSRMAVPLSPSGGVWTGQNSDFAVVKKFWWVDRPKLFLHQNWP